MDGQEELAGKPFLSTTKHDTLVAAVNEIQRLERETTTIAGCCTVPKPLGRKRSHASGRPPNKFLQFSKAFRGCFIELLQKTMMIRHPIR